MWFKFEFDLWINVNHWGKDQVDDSKEKQNCMRALRTIPKSDVNGCAINTELYGNKKST